MDAPQTVLLRECAERPLRDRRHGQVYVSEHGARVAQGFDAVVVYARRVKRNAKKLWAAGCQHARTRRTKSA